MKRLTYLVPFTQHGASLVTAKHGTMLVTTKHCAMLVAMLCTILLLCSCGKKGAPVPQDARSVFSWTDSSAEFSGDCMIISATAEGAYENIDSVGLELETVTEEICLECPFKPSEFPPLTPIAQDKGVFSFQYCPTNQAEVYRWRLVGRNIYPYQAHALSPVQLARKAF